MSEAKSGSAALSANGNRKDSLNLLKKSVKSKLDSVGRAELEETASPSTRKSLRLQEKKTVPTSCDDLVMLEEVLTPKEKESKVNSKTTLGTKDKGLNNEKNSQKGKGEIYLHLTNASTLASVGDLTGSSELLGCFVRQYQFGIVFTA